VLCRLTVVALVVAAALLATACGEEAASGARGRVKVVATTTQAADLARNVGGSQVDVVGLLPPNADPHAYEVRPRDAAALADADLIIRSGGDVDDWLTDAIEGAGADAPVVTLSDEIPEIRTAAGADPHWWQDPHNAVTAIAEINRALDRLDPAHKSGYDRDTAAYWTKLRRLDRAVAACIRKIPGAQRKLVTTHDSLAYYARRYGLEVIGAVIPSPSTAGQPSAGETAALVRTIRDAGVKAIFAESSVNPKVEEAIAREAGATVGRPLWADTLGPPDSDGATYVKSIAANTSAIADGLTGGAVSCP
jgi:ABC-type Zn uptake system ZnuABC Zn-binding protein ZnuA